MPSDRFYIDAPLEGELSLKETEYHHLVKVMRAKEEDVIELINGKGFLAKAKITSISKKEALLQIISSEKKEIPFPLFSLAIPFMRPSKLELVIEKCTELGAFSFLLYPAQFSEKEDLSEHQMDRLKHIAIGAMKQCGRLYLPEIQKITFFQLLEKQPLFFANPKSKNKLSPQKEPFFLVTGPEKGLSSKEEKLLEKKAGAVSLHQNILRAETAPIAAASILSYQSFLNK